MPISLIYNSVFCGTNKNLLGTSWPNLGKQYDYQGIHYRDNHSVVLKKWG